LGFVDERTEANQENSWRAGIVLWSASSEVD